MTAGGISGPVVGLTGTPGTGKSTLAAGLRTRGMPVLDLSRYVGDRRFDLGTDDAHHGAVVIDEHALGEYLGTHLASELSLEQPYEGPVFVESHFAHDLACVDRVLVLRCRPSALATRLAQRAWPEAKVRENLEAEAMDLIVQEALMRRESETREGRRISLGELDTTDAAVDELCTQLVALATAPSAQLQIGTVDWSDEVLGWY